MGLIVTVIDSSLYCNATNGNAHALFNVNQVLIGIYKFLPRIDGSAPLVFLVYIAFG